MDHQDNPYSAPSLSPGESATIDNHAQQDIGQKTATAMVSWQSWMMMLATCSLLAGCGAFILMLTVLSQRAAYFSMAVDIIALCAFFAVLLLTIGYMVLIIRQKSRQFISRQSTARLDQLLCSLNTLWRILGIAGIILAAISAFYLIRAVMMFSKLSM